MAQVGRIGGWSLSWWQGQFPKHLSGSKCLTTAFIYRVAVKPAVAPKKQTRGLRVTTQLLELLWTAIAKRLMQSLAIVEHLNILRDGVAGFGLMLEAPMPD